METINTVELSDEAVYPDKTVLKGVLGPSYDAYEELLALFEEHGLLCEWRYYRDGKAWLCKVQKKKRTILWMSAWKGYMQAAIYVPLRLVEGVLALDLAEELKKKIGDTKNVGKSKPCIFEVRSKEILPDLEKAILFKIANK